MKKLVLTLLIITFSLLLSGESKIDEVFQNALHEYETKNYENALRDFLSVENEDLINADLYYNIGNCYFRLNQIGKSILYYKKALKIESDHASARKNLEFALTLTKDKQKIVSEDVIRSFWDKLFDSLSINLLAVIAIIIFGLIILLICFMIVFYRNRERTVPIFIYSGPGEDFTRVFTIHEGMIFEIEREEDNWSLIKLPNGLGGWVHKENFELIKL
jgi:tetratricopeptide (TPR) repeat protein